MDKLARLKGEWEKVLAVLAAYEGRIDPTCSTPLSEFQQRQRLVQGALARRGFDAGVVFSDEHYCGDVPYLGGNTNVSIEQVAGIIGPTGFHILAGLEGGYVAEQLAPRAGAITLESEEPLGEQIVTMLDVALRGFGNHWNDVVIPGFDYIVVENTLGKFGRRVEALTKLPLNLQGMVGNVGEPT